jgi:8-amino-7-oxononanoate synthase
MDEAHATGVLGTHGRGLLDSRELFGPQDPDAVIAVGTLSKAIGSQGGFVCGSQRLCTWIVNRVRPYIFSTALSPVTAAAARRAVEIISDEPERRQHLLALAKFLRDRLLAAGYPATPSQCQIVPVVVRDSRAAVELSRRLRERGLLVPAIRPPSVPAGTARLRISLTAGHTEEDVNQLVEAIHCGWKP